MAYELQIIFCVLLMYSMMLVLVVRSDARKNHPSSRVPGTPIKSKGLGWDKFFLMATVDSSQINISVQRAPSGHCCENRSAGKVSES